ncbi:MAG: sugar transferase, partial [Clostridium sp.]|nr:sugar transferase [Clostridium sp.]
MNNFDKYRRMIKLLFGLLLTLALSGIYWIIFEHWLNHIIWAPFWRRGIWMMVFIYTVLLAFFLMIYGGYRIGVLRVGNLIYSQTLALFFANFITYFQITVQDKKFTTPMPIIVNFAISIITAAILTAMLSRVYSAIFPPRRLLLAYGERKDFNLMEKMSTRDDKYVIAKTLPYQAFIDDMETQVSLYDAVIVGDIPSHERNLIIKYCYSRGVRTYTVPKLSDILTRSSEEFNLFDSPLLLSRNVGLQFEQEWIKRGMDLAFSIVG